MHLTEHGPIDRSVSIKGRESLWHQVTAKLLVTASMTAYT